MVTIPDIWSKYQNYGQHTRNMVNIPEIWSTDQKYGQQIRNMVNRPKIWSTYQRYCHHTGLDRLDWLNWLDWQGWCGWQGRQGWQGRYMANLKLWITDRADRAYSRIILPTIAYRLQIWNYHWLAHPQHQLQGDDIASKKIAGIGIGMATGGIHPTGFEFHPTPIPTGGVLLFCRSLQHTRIVIELPLLGVPRLTFGERGTWLGEWPLLVAEMQKA